jgi:predicted PurR-regulated permease PerM
VGCLFVRLVVFYQVMGDSLELHPITVMLCLIFWGMLWGIPGESYFSRSVDL